MNDYQIEQHKGFVKISFKAMASPCEVLLRDCDASTSQAIALLASSETRRIEQKYSRYIKGNLVDRLNHSNANKVSIDQETKQLLDYAGNLYQLSDGLFDITSGVLRQAWQFKPGSTLPTDSQVQSLLALIGFEKIKYNQHHFCMPERMQIDWGGMVKEYAVDKVADLISSSFTDHAFDLLVNFGGDLRAINRSTTSENWMVGVEQVEQTKQTEKTIGLANGAIATSGTLKRYFIANGKNYSHILNPKTGYPIQGLPRSITTFAPCCVLAGSYSSLAMLQGSNAETFLLQEGIKNICIW
ncbi:MAG: FAD:protein FMN transferase [Enterobacterales bacterium]|nr:FAD:protein FMN transferase [Enterobacterales bacterium]